MSELPPGVARHFAGITLDLSSPADRGHVVERLLENGDRRDLSWLVSEIPTDEIALWFRRHGSRRLSRRSRALWSAALGMPHRAASSAAVALWPLA